MRALLIRNCGLMDRFRSWLVWLRSARAFTLIELLVVILILGILIAVAAPSFLGQTQKAEDSAAKQQLSVAYRVAKAAVVREPGQGEYVNGSFTHQQLADAIAAAEPQFVTAVGDQGQNKDPQRVFVDAAGSDATTAARLVLHNQSQSGLYCTLDAPSSGGVATACNSTGVPPPAAAGSGPTVSGTAQEGQVLTAANGSWDDATSFSYQWQNSASPWVDIPGATAQSYTLQVSDVGKIVRVCVTAHGVGGDSAPACSPATPAVVPQPPVNTALPGISGLAHVGQTLAASQGSWTNNPTSYAYQWLRCPNDASTTGCVNISPSGAAQTYVVVSADLGQYLRVVVTAANAGAPSGVAATSAATDDVRDTLTENTISLTTSGGLITDATRVSAVDGDGRSSDSSFGVWEATTNLVTNGGFETNFTGWLAFGNADARALDSSVSRFGGASLKLARVAGVAGVQGAQTSGIAAAPGETYTASAWVRLGPTMAAYQLQVSLGDLPGNLFAFASPRETDGVWTRYVMTGTVPAGITQLSIYAYHNGTSPADDGEAFWIDGVQLEQQPIATPYVHTDGATATRAAGTVLAPASAIDETQGWVAMRVRLDWPSTSPPYAYSGLFTWGNTASDGIFLYYTGGYWALERYAVGVGTQLYFADAFASGDAVTVIARWTGSQLGVSVDGGAFTAGANTNVPVVNATLFALGAGGVHGFLGHIDGDVLWLASGTGTLTNANAATLGSYSEPPNLGLIPGNATLRWSADNATAYARP